MRTTKIRYTIAFLLSNLVLALFIVGAVFLNTDFLMKRYSTDERIQNRFEMDDDTLRSTTTKALDLVKGKSTDYEFTSIVKGEEVVFLNDKEIRHVKELAAFYAIHKVIFLQMLLVMLLLLVTPFIATSDKKKLWEKEKASAAKGFLLAQAIFFSVIAVLFIAYLISPTDMINNFHRLAFKGDNWILNPVTDRLVYLCSEKLITNCVIIFVVILFIYIAIGSASSTVCLVKNKKKVKE